MNVLLPKGMYVHENVEFRGIYCSDHGTAIPVGQNKSDFGCKPYMKPRISE